MIGPECSQFQRKQTLGTDNETWPSRFEDSLCTGGDGSDPAAAEYRRLALDERLLPYEGRKRIWASDNSADQKNGTDRVCYSEQQDGV